MVTILKTGPTTTVYWDHCSGTCFKAAACCALGPSCPIGSSFLAQVVMDRVAGHEAGERKGNEEDEEGEEKRDDAPPQQESWRINVLVFDVQSWGSQKNFLRNPIPAHERYALLLAMLPASECMKAQWAGDLHALRQFRAREVDTLPHIMDCYMRLGTTSPCELGLLHC